MCTDFHNKRKAIVLCTQITNDAGLPSYGELIQLIRRARLLLDSVAFVSLPGDTDKILRDIEAVRGRMP